MEFNELKPNALIEHPELGIGRIAGLEADQVVITFRSKPDQKLSVSTVLRSFAALPEGGLAAFCYEEGPEEVSSWVMNGPLRLVGATLFDLGGSGKSGKMKSRLKAIVSPEVGWDSWWKDALPAVKDSSHFEVAKSNVVKLLSPVEYIPIEPLPRKESKVAESDSPSKTQRAPARRLSEELQSLRESHAAELKQQRDSHAADLEQQRKSHAADLEQQRKSHAADLKQQRENQAADLEQQRENQAADMKRQLERWQRKEERLQGRIDTLAADKAAQREMSRIEITQDMLLRVGDAIQRIYQLEETPEECHAQLKRILPFALRDGGAELLGTVGDIVPYEARLYHTPETVDEGTPVRLSAPGVIVTGGPFEDKVILKANVVPVSEVS